MENLEWNDEGLRSTNPEASEHVEFAFRTHLERLDDVDGEE